MTDDGGSASTPRAYDPEIIRSLLHQFQWAMTAAASETLQVWSNDAFPSQEILVPTNPSKGDFNHLLKRAYRTLVYNHGLEVEYTGAILAMQNRALLDATKWTKETPLQSGLINWQDGEQLFAVARATLSAAAKASKESRKYYGTAASHIAKTFLEGAYMGQTEVGSFVVTAFTPSAQRFYFSQPSEESSSAKLHAESNAIAATESCTGGDIIETFEGVLEAVREKLNEFARTPKEEIFDEIVPIGLSYEMSTALASLTSGGDGAVTISRAYASNSNIASPPSRDFLFKASESLVLSRVANRFAVTREPEYVNLEGEVTLLDHVSSKDTRVIRLDVKNRPELKRVRIRLPQEEYEKAIDAHRNSMQVSVSGRAQKEGRFWWLYHATEVTILGRGVETEVAASEKRKTEVPGDDEASDHPRLF